MKKNLSIFVVLFSLAMGLQAQQEPSASNWRTWFITSAKEYRLPAPTSYKEEVMQVLSLQQNLDSTSWKQILYWNAGAPSYRWYGLMSKLWMTDTGYNGTLANMLLNVATYDATLAAWNTKYAYKRPRPFVADSRIKLYAVKPESPGYPCEHSVAAGVAVTVISHFFPAMKDSVTKLAQQAMASRIAAGVAFPSDTRAGFELGKKIAEKEIRHTRDYTTKEVWDGKVPEGKGLWSGKKPLMPLAGKNKTVALDSASQFRPGPPPDFAKEMEELKNFKQTFRSKANAWHYASQPTGDDLLHKKIFEYNLHLNPPRAARVYAATAVAFYDAFVACFDAKYAYWGIRPDQYDTTYQPLVPTPPFPGYPSGHAVMSGVVGELYSYFFPMDRSLFQKVAKDGAESRFQAGIHFRTDNEAGLEMGRKIAGAVIQKVQADGADKGDVLLATQQKK